MKTTVDIMLTPYFNPCPKPFLGAAIIPSYFYPAGPWLIVASQLADVIIVHLFTLPGTKTPVEGGGA